jgi:hypothetical protein
MTCSRPLTARDGQPDASRMCADCASCPRLDRAPETRVCPGSPARAPRTRSRAASMISTPMLRAKALATRRHQYAPDRPPGRRVPASRRPVATLGLDGRAFLGQLGEGRGDGAAVKARLLGDLTGGLWLRLDRVEDGLTGASAWARGRPRRAELPVDGRVRRPPAGACRSLPSSLRRASRNSSASLTSGSSFCSISVRRACNVYTTSPATDITPSFGVTASRGAGR